MTRKTKSILLISLLFLTLKPLVGQVEAEYSTRIIKAFLPYFEDKALAGFFMVAAESKTSHERHYYITKTDLNLNVIASFEETRKPSDEVASIAFNNEVLCLVYASRGQNEWLTLDPKQLAVISRIKPLEHSVLYEHSAASLSKLYAYANHGFFFNKYSLDGKMLCHFVGLDNKLRKLWEYRSDLGFPDENVLPVSDNVSSEKYIVHHIIRKKNVIATSNDHPSLLVNSTKNGQLVLHNDFNAQELVLVDYPEVYVDDSTDMAYLVGDYVHIKTKARGWLLSKMDLMQKTKTNTFVNFGSEELLEFLDVEYQDLAHKNQLGLFPYSIQKFKDGFIVTGEIYAAKPKNIIDFGLTRPQDGYSQSVFFCELDKDLHIVSLKYTDVADHKVNVKGKDSRYTTAFSGNILDARYNESLKGLELLYLQEATEKQVDYCKILYKEDGTITMPSKRPFKRSGSGDQLNIFEGKTKFTVFRLKNNGLLEITQE